MANGDEDNLKIGEDALHVMVEKLGAGSKQESQGETEYHLRMTDMIMVMMVILMVLMMKMTMMMIMVLLRKHLNALGEEDIHHPAISQSVSNIQQKLFFSHLQFQHIL